MKRAVFFAYGIACYVLFLGIYAYLAGFVGNLFVPQTIDSGSAGPVSAAVAVNLALLVLFAGQHSLMARPAFKRVWTRFIPQPIERSTYVLFSCIVLAVLMWQWRTLDGVIWDLQAPGWRTAAWVLFALGWLMVPAVTLLINHFDLFGTRQVWLHWLGREYTALPFREPLVYKHVRHPLYLGWALAFWATPTMTVGHLLFASVLSAYMVLAVFAEERDLVDHFGPQYEDYRRRVPKFVPRLKPVAAKPLAQSGPNQSTTSPSAAEACHV